MKRRALVAIAIVLGLAPVVALAAACRVSALEVGAEGDAGADAPAPPPVSDAGEEDAHTQTLEERLKALCALGEGKVDPYFSALELTQHLTGTWFECDPPDVSPLQDGDGVGMAFDGQGHWATLTWNDAKTRLTPMDGVDHSGNLRCYILATDAGASADAGTESRDIACTDPTPRNGILVYLDRSYGGPDPQRFDFTREPAGMRASENDSPYTAWYVKVE